MEKRHFQKPPKPIRPQGSHAQAKSPGKVIVEKCSVIINDIEYIRKQGVTKDYVIVRTHSAGVFAGNLESRNGKEVVLKNARRIWYWVGAASLSQLAMEGTSKPDSCKFPCEVVEITLTEAIEIIPCTEKSEKSIKGVAIWKR